MKLARTSNAGAGFKVLLESSAAQAAMMVLRPGKSSSEKPEDEHRRCEQWLYVVSGTGQATTGKRRVMLKAGSLLLIEKAEPHKITATGRGPLTTLNIYVPPAYTKKGDVKISARIPPILSSLAKAGSKLKNVSHNK